MEGQDNKAGEASSHVSKAEDEAPLARDVDLLRRWVLGALIVALLVPAAMGAWGWNRIRALEEELATRPPIAVLDVNALVMKALEANPRQSPEEAASGAYKVGEVLANKGYVVIHKGSIVAYPVEFEVAK